MSSKITSYPGVEITQAELKTGRYVLTKYETELRYAWSSGVAIGRFLSGLKAGEIWGRRCNECGRVVVPPRMYCEDCYRPNDEWVRLKDTGRVVTYSISHVNFDASRRTEPILVAVVEIEGASPLHGILHILGDVRPYDVRVGMPVKALWKESSERTGSITDIRYFKPSASAGA